MTKELSYFQACYLLIFKHFLLFCLFLLTIVSNQFIKVSTYNFTIIFLLSCQALWALASSFLCSIEIHWHGAYWLRIQFALWKKVLKKYDLLIKVNALDLWPSIPHLRPYTTNVKKEKEKKTACKQRAASAAPSVTYACTTRGRPCLSRISLISHQRRCSGQPRR